MENSRGKIKLKVKSPSINCDVVVVGGRWEYRHVKNVVLVIILEIIILHNNIIQKLIKMF